MKHIYRTICLLAAGCLATQALFAQQTTSHPEDGWDTQNRIPSTYYEDLMTNNTDIKPGHCWTVQVEPNTQIPGWYRFKPYSSISDYVPRIMQETDDTYFYINATEPDRVYAEEFEPYSDSGEYDFLNLVAENGWNGGEGRYGTLQGDVISFPPRSFALYDAGYDIWYEVSRTAGFKLVLNESEAKDYAISVTVSTCTSFPEIAYKADAGRDVWDVKGKLFAGEFRPEYYQTTLAEGEIVDTEWRQYESVSQRGLYTVVIVGVDRQGAMVSCDYDFGFNVIDDDEQWIPAGSVPFNEGFFTSRYIDIPESSYEVALEKHASIDGYFRIVNPYSSHPSIQYPQYQSDHSHSHYIYINATDITAPYIEASPVGVNLGYGDVCIASQAGLKIASGMEASEVAAEGVMFGKFDAEGTLTFPEGGLMISEKKRNKGDWSPIEATFSVKLPIDTSGAPEVIGHDSEKEYYNLQGIRISDPEGCKGIIIECNNTCKISRMIR